MAPEKLVKLAPSKGKVVQLLVELLAAYKGRVFPSYCER